MTVGLGRVVGVGLGLRVGVGLGRLVGVGRVRVAVGVGVTRGSTPTTTAPHGPATVTGRC